MPADNFRAWYPFLLLGFYKLFRDSKNKKKSADIVYMCIFYIIFFSCIGHKEKRFLLPVLPLMFLVLGYQIQHSVKVMPRIIRLIAWILIVVDGVLFL